VALTVVLIKRYSPARIERPRIENNPEDEAAWWVAVPVWFKGNVEEVFALDRAIMKEFVATISASERMRIVIDLRIE
jgi:hypothetical protein